MKTLEISVSLLFLFSIAPFLCAQETQAPKVPQAERQIKVAEDLEMSQPVYMANYAQIDDFKILADRGINTLLVDLSADGSDWKAIYDAAIKHNLRLIPLIWGKDQAVWKWNRKAKEWELNPKKYPKSKGAKFIAFLKNNPKYLDQTFAIYGFHEPLHKPKKTGPEVLKKFYQQITEEEFPGGKLAVYGEDITMGWPDSDACLTGVLDYETHNVYPFAKSETGNYRPFDVKINYFGPATSDFDKVLKASIAKLDHRLKRYANAEPSATGRRPKPIVLIQSFASQEEPDLWNRMPSAKEMETLAQYLVSKRKQTMGGLAWYSFRNPSTDYSHSLFSNRIDAAGKDRWQVIDSIGKQLYSKD